MTSANRQLSMSTYKILKRQDSESIPTEVAVSNERGHIEFIWDIMLKNPEVAELIFMRDARIIKQRRMPKARRNALLNTT